jgi:hypothetical protein
MATLSTLLVNGNSVNGPREWTAQDFATIDEPIGSPDAAEIACNTNPSGTTSEDTSFLLANVDSDFGNMTALSYQIRYRVGGAQTNSRSLGIRIVRESDGTVLAAANAGGDFMTVASGISSTTFVNSSVVAFTYINTGANKAAWDDARVEIRSTSARNMAGDTNGLRVDTLQMTGTYEVSVSGTDYEQDLGDSLSLTDAITARVVHTVRGDGISLSDEISKLIDKSLSDGISLSDSLNKDFILLREDAISIADEDIRQIIISLQLNDDVSLSDTHFKTFEGNLTDDISLADELSKAAGKSLADEISLTDEQLNLFAFNLTDSITMSDEDIRQIIISLELNDDVSFDDAQSRLFSLLQSDEISLTDDTAKLIGIIQADSLLLTDEETRQIIIPIELADGISLSDALSKDIGHSLSDVLMLADAQVKQISIVREDVLSLGDEFDYSISDGSDPENYTLELSEAISFSDTLNSSIVEVGINFTSLKKISTISNTSNTATSEVLMSSNKKNSTISHT